MINDLLLDVSDYLVECLDKYNLHVVMVNGNDDWICNNEGIL